MNDPEFNSGMTTGFCIGLILCVLGIIFTAAISESYWEYRAIKHGAAQYNATTGAFEWKAGGK